MKIYTNEFGHMTNMAAMPIYNKNLRNIFFSRTNRSMTLKLGMLHCLCEYYQGYSNYDPGLNLTYLRKGQIWSHRLLYRKKRKLLFLETIAALGLKVA